MAYHSLTQVWPCAVLEDPRSFRINQISGDLRSGEIPDTADQRPVRTQGTVVGRVLGQLAVSSGFLVPAREQNISKSPNNGLCETALTRNRTRHCPDWTRRARSAHRDGPADRRHSQTDSETAPDRRRHQHRIMRHRAERCATFDAWHLVSDSRHSALHLTRGISSQIVGIRRYI